MNKKTETGSVIFVKLGGGLIAPKDWEEQTPDFGVIRRLAGEIKEGMKGRNDLLVLGNGAGNFAHNAAQKYETAKGFEDDDVVKKIGACITQLIAAKLNKLVVEELIRVGVSAAAVAPHDLILAKGKTLSEVYVNSVEVMLRKGIVPVVYGDVIWDEINGCVIFSTETVLGILAGELKKRGWKINNIVQVSREDGVWDSDKKLISKIDLGNWENLQKELVENVGADVTGGMRHKVETSLEIAEKIGVETWIISGRAVGRLEGVLKGGKVSGTIISN